MPNRTQVEKTKEEAKRYPVDANKDPAASRAREITLKWWPLGTTSVPMNAQIVVLNYIPQNGTQRGRLGRAVEMVSIDIIGHITADNTVLNDVTRTFQVAVIYDNCPGTGIPGLPDIFESSNGTAPNASDQSMPVDKGNEKRFKYLFQQRVAWPAVGAVGGTEPNLTFTDAHWRDPAGSSPYFEAHVPLKGLPVKWKSSAAAAYSDFYTGAVFLLAWGGPANFLVKVNTQICYRDNE